MVSTLKRGKSIHFKIMVITAPWINKKIGIVTYIPNAPKTSRKRPNLLRCIFMMVCSIEGISFVESLSGDFFDHKVVMVKSVFYYVVLIQWGESI